MSFFGELYLRSTLPFFSEAATAVEVAYLERAFADVAPSGFIADLGCGHGRHAAPLNTRGPLAGRVLGMDFDPLSLRERLPGFPAVRGDLQVLPFRTASLAGAYAWYTTLFVFNEEDHLPLLRGIARCLKPGALFVMHTLPWEHAAAQPPADYSGYLPDGSYLEETSHFDAARGRDVLFRRMTRPDGRVLASEFTLRYYPLPELVQMLESTGFSMSWAHGGFQGEPLTADSRELIVAAVRRAGEGIGPEAEAAR